jgi:hypothetical protein
MRKRVFNHKTNSYSARSYRDQARQRMILNDSVTGGIFNVNAVVSFIGVMVVISIIIVILLIFSKRHKQD